MIAGRILGVATVRRLFDQLNQELRQTVWEVTGHAGEVPLPRGGLLRDQVAIDRNAAGLIEEYDIRTPGSQVEGGNLSGGNQQKLIVAREFSRKPRLLIAAQPTRGIDVGSIEFIHRRIVEQRDEGAAVLLVSAELDEIMALSDRIAVLYKGEIIDTLPAEEATREQLGLLMAGIKNGGAVTA
jgi:simple sugar transport system ATP-binding protein